MPTLSEALQATHTRAENGTSISQEVFEIMLKEHHVFMIEDNAGGFWETYQIEDLIVGAYYGEDYKNSNKGEQAMLAFQNLMHLKLSNIKLRYANCIGVQAKNQIWDGADLEGSIFTNAILTGCSFKNVDLSGVDFSRSDMRNCNFEGAILDNTDFEDCNLEGAKNMAT